MTSSLRSKEKKLFKENVLEIRLLYQIAGEDLPSLLNDEYDCQVILFLNVQLNKLKNASFVGHIFQRLINPYVYLGSVIIRAVNFTVSVIKGLINRIGQRWLWKTWFCLPPFPWNLKIKKIMFGKIELPQSGS